MAVALCVMARRGDEQLVHVLATVPSADEVDFVATLSEPAVVEPAPAPVQRASV
jgi:hypothetical protein